MDSNVDLKPIQNEIKKLKNLVVDLATESKTLKTEMTEMGKAAKSSSAEAVKEYKELEKETGKLKTQVKNLTKEKQNAIKATNTYRSKFGKEAAAVRKSADKIEELSDSLTKLKAKYKSIETTIKKQTRSYTGLGNVYEQTANSLARATKEIEKVKKSLAAEKTNHNVTTKALKDLTQEYKRLKQISQDLGKTNSRLRSQNKKLVENYLKTNKAMAEQNKKIKSLTSNYKKIEKDVEKLNKALKKLQESQKKTSRGWGDGSDGLVRFNRQLRQVLPFLTTTMLAWKSMEMFQHVINEGGKFRQEMVKVNAILQTTTKEAKDLEVEIRNLGSTTEWTAVQVASGAKYLGMAGLTAVQTTKALASVLELSTAGQIDLAKASDISSNAMVAMGLSVDELSRVNDTFIATTTMSNVSIKQMADTFRYAAPKAKAYGYSIEALSAMIGVLGNSGVQGSLAGTQLSFAMGKVDSVFKKLGMSGSGKSLLDALEAINEKGWTTGDVFKSFAERGGRAAVMLRDVIPLVRLMQKRIEESKGISKKIAEDMRNTFVNDLKILKSAFSELGITIFDEWNDSLRSASQNMTKFVYDNKDGIVEFFGDIGRGVNSAAKSLSGFAPIIGEIGKALGFLGDTFERHPVMMSGMALMMTGNPILAVGGAAASVYALTETSMSKKAQDMDVKKMMEEKYSLKDVTEDNWAEKLATLNAKQYVNIWKDYKDILISQIDKGIKGNIDQNLMDQSFLETNVSFLGKDYVEKEILRLKKEEKELKSKLSPLSELNEKNVTLLIKAWESGKISEKRMMEIAEKYGKDLNFDASEILGENKNNEEIQKLLETETAWLGKQVRQINQFSKAKSDFEFLLQDLNIKPSTVLGDHLKSLGISVDAGDIRKVGKSFDKFNVVIQAIKDGLKVSSQSRLEIEKALAQKEQQIRYKQGLPESKKEYMLFVEEPENYETKFSQKQLEGLRKALEEQLKGKVLNDEEKEKSIKGYEKHRDDFLRNFALTLKKERERKIKIRQLEQELTDQETIDMASLGYLSFSSVSAQSKLSSAKIDEKVSKGDLSKEEGDLQKDRNDLENILDNYDTQFSVIKERAEKQGQMTSKMPEFIEAWNKYETYLSYYYENVLGASPDQTAETLRKKKERIVGENTELKNLAKELDKNAEIKDLIKELDKNAELMGKTDLQKKLIKIEDTPGDPGLKKIAKMKTVENAYAEFKQKTIGESKEWEQIYKDFEIMTKNWNIQDDPEIYKVLNFLSGMGNSAKGEEQISLAKLRFDELGVIQGEYQKKIGEIKKQVSAGNITEEEGERLTSVANEWKKLSNEITNTNKELKGFFEVSEYLGVKTFDSMTLALKDYTLSLNELGMMEGGEGFAEQIASKKTMLNIDFQKSWYSKISNLGAFDGSKEVLEKIKNNLTNMDLENLVDWSRLFEGLSLEEEQAEKLKEQIKKNVLEIDKKDKKDDNLQDRLSLYRDYYKDVAGMAEGLYSLEIQLAEKNYEKNLEIFKKMKGVNAEVLAQAIKQEEIFRASREIILAKGSGKQGINIYFTELKKEMTSAAEFWYDALKTVETELTNSFSDAMFSAIKGDMEGLESAFKGMGDNILKSFTNQMAEQFVKENIIGSLEFLLPGVGNMLNSPELNEAKTHTNILHSIDSGIRELNGNIGDAGSSSSGGSSGSGILGTLGSLAMMYASIKTGNYAGAAGTGLGMVNDHLGMFGEYSGVVDTGLKAGGAVMAGYGLYNSIKNEDVMGGVVNAASLAKNLSGLYEKFIKGTLTQAMSGGANATSGINIVLGEGESFLMDGTQVIGKTLADGSPVYGQAAPTGTAADGISTKLDALGKIGAWVMAGANMYTTITNWDDYGGAGKGAAAAGTATSGYSAYVAQTEGLAAAGPYAIIAAFLMQMALASKDGYNPKGSADTKFTKTGDSQLYDIEVSNFEEKQWRGMTQEKYGDLIKTKLIPFQMFFKTFDQDTQGIITKSLPDLDYGRLEYEAPEEKEKEGKDFGFEYYKDISDPYEHFQDVETQNGTIQKSLGTYADTERVPLFTKELDDVFWSNAGRQIVDQTIGGIESWKDLPDSIFSLLRPSKGEFEKRSGRDEYGLVPAEIRLDKDVANLLGMEEKANISTENQDKYASQIAELTQQLDETTGQLTHEWQGKANESEWVLTSAGKEKENIQNQIDELTALQGTPTDIVSLMRGQYTVPDLQNVLDQIAAAQLSYGDMSKYVAGKVFGSGVISEDVYSSKRESWGKYGDAFSTDAGYEKMDTDLKKTITDSYTNYFGEGKGLLDEDTALAVTSALEAIDGGLLHSAEGMEKYREQIQAAIEPVTKATEAWKASEQTIDEMTGHSLISFDKAMENANDSFTSMIGSLTDAGVASEKVAEIEARRAEVMNTQAGLQLTGWDEAFTASAISSSWESGSSISDSFLNQLMTNSQAMAINAVTPGIQKDYIDPALAGIGEVLNNKDLSSEQATAAITGIIDGINWDEINARSDAARSSLQAALNNSLEVQAQSAANLAQAQAGWAGTSDEYELEVLTKKWNIPDAKISSTAEFLKTDKSQDTANFYRENKADVDAFIRLTDAIDDTSMAMYDVSEAAGGGASGGATAAVIDFTAALQASTDAMRSTIESNWLPDYAATPKFESSKSMKEDFGTATNPYLGTKNIDSSIVTDMVVRAEPTGTPSIYDHRGTEGVSSLFPYMDNKVYFAPGETPHGGKTTSGTYNIDWEGEWDKGGEYADLAKSLSTAIENTGKMHLDTFVGRYVDPQPFDMSASRLYAILDTMGKSGIEAMPEEEVQAVAGDFGNSARLTPEFLLGAFQPFLEDYKTNVDHLSLAVDSRIQSSFEELIDEDASDSWAKIRLSNAQAAIPERTDYIQTQWSAMPFTTNKAHYDPKIGTYTEDVPSDAFYTAGMLTGTDFDSTASILSEDIVNYIVGLVTDSSGDGMAHLRADFESQYKDIHGEYAASEDINQAFNEWTDGIEYMAYLYKGIADAEDEINGKLEDRVHKLALLQAKTFDIETSYLSNFQSNGNISGRSQEAQYLDTYHRKGINEVFGTDTDLSGISNTKLVDIFMGISPAKWDELIEAAKGNLDDFLEHIQYFVDGLESIKNGDERKWIDDFVSTMFTPFENALAGVDREVIDVISNLDGLAEYVAEQQGLEDVEEYKKIIKGVIEAIGDIKKLQLAKGQMTGLVNAQAGIMGLEDENTLMQLSMKYNTPFDTQEQQRSMVDALSMASFDDFLKLSTDLNIPLETIYQDMTNLSNIVNSVSDEFEDLADSLSDYAKSLVLSDKSYISPELKTSIAKDNFMEIYQKAMSADKDISAAAMQELPGAADIFLDLSQQSNTGLLDYNKDFSLVLSSLQNAEDHANSYVAKTDDSLTEEEKANKKLDQLSHLEGMNANIIKIDNQIMGLWENQDIKSFFRDFSNAFDDNQLELLEKSITKLNKIIRTWHIDTNELTDFEIMSDSDRELLANAEISWDSQAGIDFLASISMDFEYMFAESMGVLHFIDENGIWALDATANFVTDYARYNTGTFIEDMEFLKFIADSTGGYSSNLSAKFISNYEGFDELSFKERLEVVGFLGDEYGYNSAATLAFLSNDSAFSTLTYEQALEAVGLINDGTGWNSNAMTTFLSNTGGFDTLPIERQMELIGLSLDADQQWGGYASYGLITNLADSGLPWDSVRNVLVEKGVSDDNINKYMYAYLSGSSGSLNWGDISTILGQHGVEDDNIEKTISGYYEDGNLSFNELSELMNMSTLPIEARRSIFGAYTSTTLTSSEMDSIINNWGDISQANLNASISASVNVDSNTLLTKTTFNEFAHAFLGVSDIWGDDMMPNPSNPQGYYSIIDGILLLFNQLQGNYNNNAPGMRITGGGSASFPESMTVNGSVSITNPVSSMFITNFPNSMNVGGAVTVTNQRTSMGIYGTVSLRSTDSTYLRLIKENLQSLNEAIDGAVPKYAAGGYHDGGWRLVGEEGPEMEYTGSSRIFNASDTKGMFGSNSTYINTTDLGSKEIVSELKKMRSENAEMREDLKVANKQIIKLTNRINNREEKWDNDGFPGERAA